MYHVKLSMRFGFRQGWVFIVQFYLVTKMALDIWVVMLAGTASLNYVTANVDVIS